MKIVPTIDELNSFAKENRWLLLGTHVTDKKETVYHWLTTSGNQVIITYYQENGETVHIKVDNT
jgi:5-keto 4-deoxyuronate isomerase